MFSKLSRYRLVPDIAVSDARGRVVAAKDSRPLPVVTGTFSHTVDAGDRLDQLAATFYGQPLFYWHICDANPQFLSPLALLGKEPVVITRFPLTAPAGEPPWGALLAKLADLVGVEDVRVIDDVELAPAGVAVDQHTLAVAVTYNRVNLSAADVADAIALTGFGVGPPVDSGQLGQQIVIPAPENG